MLEGRFTHEVARAGGEDVVPCSLSKVSFHHGKLYVAQNVINGKVLNNYSHFFTSDLELTTETIIIKVNE